MSTQQDTTAFAEGLKVLATSDKSPVALSSEILQLGNGKIIHVPDGIDANEVVIAYNSLP